MADDLEQNLDNNISEDSLAEWIDSIKRSPDLRNSLVESLPERNPLYLDRSSNETTRIRGYILAAFEEVGLPEAALPYVLDELENGRDAYVVAGAAKALRGLSMPMLEVIPFLFKAIANIKYEDDALTFESYKPQWPIVNYTTALKEIFITFQWLGYYAQDVLSDLEALYEDRNNFSETTRKEIKNAIDSIRASRKDKDVDTGCCTMPIIPISSVECCQNEEQNSDLIADVEFEDQDSNIVKYSEFFSHKPSIVVFFYCRCNNPNKCSLTITKLAKLQLAIKELGLEEQLKTAAITYDPEYDLPSRLKAYGENRGMLFDHSNRSLRTRIGFKELQDYFCLGVNFNKSIVNRHRIELFILNDKGRIVVTFARLQWDIDEVIKQAKLLLQL